jgi:hypothetical protein
LIDWATSPPGASASIDGDASGTGWVISTASGPMSADAVRAPMKPVQASATGNAAVQSGGVIVPSASVRLASR